MANAVPKPSNIKLYYGQFIQIWNQLQLTYIKMPDDDSATLLARRAFFRNSLSSVFAQIDAVHASHDAMLATLTDFVMTAEGGDGLESVLLTLLNIANIKKNKAGFDAGVTAWKKFASNPTKSGAGPLAFYDVTTKSVAFFSSDMAHALRPGAFLVYETDIATALNSKAKLVLQNPFKVATPAPTHGPVASHPPAPVSHAAVRHEDVHVLDSTENATGSAWSNGFGFLANTLVAVGTAMELLPLGPETQVIGGFIKDAGEAIQAGVEIVKAYNFVENLSTLSSVPAPAPEVDLPAPSGSLILNDQGSYGVLDPSVDSSGSFDTSGTGNDGTGDDGDGTSGTVDQPPGDSDGQDPQ